MATTKKYWKSNDELAETPVAQQLAQNEFAEEIPVEDFLGNENALGNSSTTRRDFLKYLGFSTAAATLAACESPVVNSIPYVVKPDSLTPGVPNYYASTFYDGHDFASILVKTREGRPIKVEPNDMAMFNGGTNARVQASVLSLYDSARLRHPMKGGEEVNWTDVLASLRSELEAANNSGKQVVLMTSSIISPSTSKVIADLGAAYTNFKHVTYDPVSFSAKLDLWNDLTGMRAIPTYKLANAKLVVGVGADFLFNYTGQDMASEYAEARTPGEGMIRHIQIETQLSLTGANADKRLKLKSSQQGAALLHLYNVVAGGTGNATLAAAELPAELKTSIQRVGEELLKNRGKSLVLAGNNNYAQEALAAGINNMLGNMGTTVDTATPVYLRSGDDKAVATLMSDMKAGKVGALLTWGVNPSYSLNGFADASSKVATTAALTDRMDETARNFGYALPVNHYLESWGDVMPTSKVYGMVQPTIRPLFDSKHGQDILLALAGKDADYYSYLKNFFMMNMQVSHPTLSWNTILHDGMVEVSSMVEPAMNAEAIDMNAAASSANKEAKGAGEIELFFYQKNGLGNGNQANNPWLQELPDPISRVSWDNYATISQADAAEGAWDLETSTDSTGAYNGKTITIQVGDKTLEKVPVFVQPGQAQGTIGLAVGYGRTDIGKAGSDVGVNAYVLMGNDHYVTDAKITAKSDDHEHGFACIQLAHTMMGRRIVNETTLDTFLGSDPSEWNELPLFDTYQGKMRADKVNLWEDHDHETGNMWNMSMDLNKCLGCGACVVACHLENNVPVVGKDEVRKHRDMHWLRIDRYYSSEDTFSGDEEKVEEMSGLFGENGSLGGFNKLEAANENPQVVFQPVMCQHCNHAPCETVCPVGATAHSKEGLNHMAYNRCIGTRYCANNCPYKVRRFNWFNYQGNESRFGDVNPALDEYGKMVLNPDVVVRARGVMEKCSMCIQRIQYNKLEAKKAGKPIEDGAFTTACAQACGTGAIVFGDVNNPESAIAKVKQDPRAYHLLEEVGTQPSVFYQTKVRNA
ncbi:TAT-variant-translocated molybdopterin oxidoreductase [Phaeocystidibacter marisrubri]|uniref:4Fe-4S dicluster domain-containing protein n=1 Tax=Phaeocystidibacter marisrubri TaxID=1577780 RepID=A0A6L3ZH18_9FLAO|nr:TAT-variant-translocated molybdopterin oxidoreductase [Phaeocystidibacter marisrubri]KAB2816913.1 4Fe-4S dicluster domain-containing protein [Phaeocystidibacter marisrubri]GGH77621.1 quinol:cytochrome C oxidoreductase [Phaeocystidibacter marisrubri]